MFISFSHRNKTNSMEGNNNIQIRILKINYIIFITFVYFMCEYFSEGMSLYHMYFWCLWRTEYAVRLPESWVSDGYEPQGRCWDSNPDALKVHLVLLTTESPFLL